MPVKNWLHERQRFDVKVELMDPDPSSQDTQGINLQGVSTLDLPPGLERDYRFSIYSYHETSALVRVSFTSQQTGEFMVVEVELEFYAPQSLATIKMEAACRQQVRHKIAVANPLNKPARFIGMSSNPCIRFAQELEALEQGSGVWTGWSQLAPESLGPPVFLGGWPLDVRGSPRDDLAEQPLRPGCLAWARRA